MPVDEEFKQSTAVRAAQFLTGSVAAQGLAALSGLLLARWMSVEDYGLYTVVTVIMGAVTLLTKGGAHIGYTAILGRVWPDLRRAAEAVAAVLSIRRTISLFVMPPIIFSSAVLLQQNGAGSLQITATSGMLVVFWWADMRTRLVDQLLFFAKQTSRVQFLDAGLSLMRLLGVILFYVFGVLDLLAATALGVSVALLRIFPIVTWVRALLPMNYTAEPQPNDLYEISLGVKKQLPVEFYQVFQSQIVIALITFFGTVNDIAGFGALTRINQIFLPIDAMVYAFFVPKFSTTKSGLPKLYYSFILLSVFPGLFVVVVAWLFPYLLLYLVGPNYVGLDQEMLIASVVAMISRGASTAWVLLAHRGWVNWSWLQIPIGLAFCTLTPFVVDVGTLSGALLLPLSFTFGLIFASTVEFRAAVNRGELK